MSELQYQYSKWWRKKKTTDQKNIWAQLVFVRKKLKTSIINAIIFRILIDRIKIIIGIIK